jgi:hypothetical protein
MKVFKVTNMPPSIETLEKLDIKIPEYGGASHPICKGQAPLFYKKISDTAEGKTSRTHFFEKNLVGLYLALGRPVPYAFRTQDGSVRSLDAGCVKFLCNRRVPEAELIRDAEGYIVAVRPLAPLLTRFDAIQDRVTEPYLSLARLLELPFDISSPVDEKRRIQSEQVIRDGAVAFRQSVLRAWNNRCAVSGINVSEVLEAAHIYPYLGAATNDLRNAILLKSDLHKLFDAHLLSLQYVDTSLTVRVSNALQDTAYAKYHGKIVKLPKLVTHQPAIAIVEYHLQKLFNREQSTI